MLGRVIKVGEYLNITTDEVVYEVGKVAILNGKYVTIVREQDLKYGGFGEWGTIDGIERNPKCFRGDYVHQLHYWVNIVATNNPELITLGYPEIDGDVTEEGDVFIDDIKLPDTGFFIWKKRGGIYPNIVDGKVRIFLPSKTRLNYESIS